MPLRKKYNVLGIDPAKNIAKQANKKKIKTISKFFNFKNSKKIEKIRKTRFDNL